MTEDGTWYIFHIYNKSEKGVAFDAVRPIEISEKDLLIDADKKVSDFFRSQNVVQSVYANRNDVLEAMVEMAKAYSEKSRSPQEIMERAVFDIARRFANTCSLFRSFLDHYDRYFCDNHESESEQRVAWKASLSREYDGELAYRIVSMMRNYIQHYDMPPLAISISDSVDKPGFETRIDIDINELTRDRKIARKLEATGDALPERLSLYATIDRWSHCFDRIVTAANLIKAKDVKDHVSAVLNVRRSTGIGDTGRLAVIFLPKTDIKPENITLSVKYLEENKARIISALVDA